MKLNILIGALIVLALNAHATLYTFDSGTGAGVIPDADSGGAVGISFTGGVTGFSPDLISDISISLNISGGYNNDLYGYLRSPDGTLVTLLNRPGSLYTSGSGFNIVLGISGTSIQAATETPGAVLGDGVTMYQSAENMTAFYNHSASGTWTLYFQDLSPGESSTLNSWTLNITAVPEPVHAALAGFAAMTIGACAYRITRARIDNRSSN